MSGRRQRQPGVSHHSQPAPDLGAAAAAAAADCSGHPKTAAAPETLSEATTTSETPPPETHSSLERDSSLERSSSASSSQSSSCESADGVFVAAAAGAAAAAEGVSSGGGCVAAVAVAAAGVVSSPPPASEISKLTAASAEVAAEWAAPSPTSVEELTTSCPYMVPFRQVWWGRVRPNTCERTCRHRSRMCSAAALCNDCTGYYCKWVAGLLGMPVMKSSGRISFEAQQQDSMGQLYWSSIARDSCCAAICSERPVCALCVRKYQLFAHFLPGNLRFRQMVHNTVMRLHQSRGVPADMGLIRKATRFHLERMAVRTGLRLPCDQHPSSAVAPQIGAVFNAASRHAAPLSVAPLNSTANAAAGSTIAPNVVAPGIGGGTAAAAAETNQATSTTGALNGSALNASALNASIVGALNAINADALNAFNAAALHAAAAAAAAGSQQQRTPPPPAAEGFLRHLLLHHQRTTATLVALLSAAAAATTLLPMQQQQPPHDASEPPPAAASLDDDAADSNTTAAAPAEAPAAASSEEDRPGSLPAEESARPPVDEGPPEGPSAPSAVRRSSRQVRRPKSYRDVVDPSDESLDAVAGAGAEEGSTAAAARSAKKRRSSGSRGAFSPPSPPAVPPPLLTHDRLDDAMESFAKQFKSEEVAAPAAGASTDTETVGLAAAAGPNSVAETASAAAAALAAVKTNLQLPPSSYGKNDDYLTILGSYFEGRYKGASPSEAGQQSGICELLLPMPSEWFFETARKALREVSPPSPPGVATAAKGEAAAADAYRGMTESELEQLHSSQLRWEEELTRQGLRNVFYYPARRSWYIATPPPRSSSSSTARSLAELEGPDFRRLIEIYVWDPRRPIDAIWLVIHEKLRHENSAAAFTTISPELRKRIFTFLHLLHSESGGALITTDGQNDSATPIPTAGTQFLRPLFRLPTVQLRTSFVTCEGGSDDE